MAPSGRRAPAVTRGDRHELGAERSGRRGNPAAAWRWLSSPQKGTSTCKSVAGARWSTAVPIRPVGDGRVARLTLSSSRCESADNMYGVAAIGKTGARNMLGFANTALAAASGLAMRAYQGTSTVGTLFRLTRRFSSAGSSRRVDGSGWDTGTGVCIRPRLKALPQESA